MNDPNPSIAVDPWANLQSQMSPKSLYPVLDDALSPISLGNSSADPTVIDLIVAVPQQTYDILRRNPEIESFLIQSVMAASERLLAHRNASGRLNLRRLTVECAQNPKKGIHFVPTVERAAPVVPIAKPKKSGCTGIFYVLEGEDKGQMFAWDTGELGLPRLPERDESEDAWGGVDSLQQLLSLRHTSVPGTHWIEGETAKWGGVDVCFIVQTK